MLKGLIKKDYYHHVLVLLEFTKDKPYIETYITKEKTMWGHPSPIPAGIALAVLYSFCTRTFRTSVIRSSLLFLSLLKIFVKIFPLSSVVLGKKYMLLTKICNLSY